MTHISDIIEEEVVAMQDWLDYLVKAGYINAKFDVRSFAQRISEAGKKEGAGEAKKVFKNYWYFGGEWHRAECPFIMNDHGVCNCKGGSIRQEISARLSDNN